jgi:beta-glucosidase|tara:strand:- start:6153 stop:8459 length:2307 start_codon:yes stop_codon:yes gene_type:complete
MVLPIGLRLALVGLVLSLSANVIAADFPYQDSSLSAEERLADLLPRMTLEEKVGQMSQYVGIEHVAASEKHMTVEELAKSDARGFYPGLHSSQMPAFIETGKVGSFLHVLTAKEANLLQYHAQKTRLGIPLLIGIDAIHGTAMVRGATVYPAPMGMASTWNLDLVRQASAETALEMRATGSHWTFTPNIDIARDARWGRVGETFGEDTYLVGEMGVATIEGLQQGDFTGPNKVIANAKHWVAGGDPINGINLSPMDVSLRTLREDFFPPFKRAIEAGVFTFMAAHNEINGVPAHSNRFILTDVLRNEWGFKGFVVSDWMDVGRLHTFHRTATSQKDAVRQTVNAGMDMHMHGPKFLPPLVELVQQGLITEDRIEASAKPILLAKFKLGLFDNPFVDESAVSDKLYTKKHQKTALEMARQSIVLLTNNNDILPLSRDTKVFVTGPNANSDAILGDWVLPQPPENITTVLEGLQALPATNIDFYDVGNQVKTLTTKDIKAAAKRAKNSDVALVVVGENPLRYDRKGKTSGENVARSSLDLFGRQLELIKGIQATGTPVIVVLVNGRPIAEPWLVDNTEAIIEAWEPGAMGGQAIAEIIYGLTNPSGKLPITVPFSVGHGQATYDHKPTAYKHKYVDAPTRNLFEFGYGLSYTNFSYTKPLLKNRIVSLGESTSVSTRVTNTGNVAGFETVQLYIRDNFSEVTRPVKELKGFKKIKLAPGQSKTVEFDVKPNMLAYYNLEMDYVVEPGRFTLMLGSSSRKSDLKKVQLKVE